MKEFKTRRGNFLKSKNTTTNMMYTVLIILVPFIIFSTYKNGIYPVIKGYGNLYLVFKPLISVVISSIFCLLTEYAEPQTVAQKTASVIELPQIVQTVQKPSLMVQIIILCDILTSFFNRSQFCFKLNPLVVVEMDVLTYEEASLLIGLEFSSINTLCFEY